MIAGRELSRRQYIHHGPEIDHNQQTFAPIEGLMYLIGRPHKRHKRSKMKFCRFVFLLCPINTMGYEGPIISLSYCSIANNRYTRHIMQTVGAIYRVILF